MKDHLILFDGSSRMPAELALGAMLDVAGIRGTPTIQRMEAQKLIDNFSRQYFNRSRGQVEERAFLRAINETEVMRHYSDAGKIILLDKDLYVDGLNWCYGSMHQTTRGFGYIVVSTARMRDEIHATDILRHELGHMFNAPSQGRRNTTQSLGLHCVAPGCVMQQKLNLDEAVEYTHQRDSDNSPVFCPDCERDVRNYTAPQ